MSLLSESRAREIASQWHGGIWSGLYALASCPDHGRMKLSQWGDAYREAVIQRASSVGRDRASLSALARWIEARARKYDYIVDYGDTALGARLAPVW